MDYDNLYQEWIAGAAYWWVPGATIKDCRRYYIVHPNAAAVFDEYLNICDYNWVSTQIYSDKLTINDTFCLFGLPCGWVSRNMNLVNVYKSDINERPYHLSNAELRICGQPFTGKVYPAGFNDGPKEKYVNIVSNTKPARTALVYPWEFGNHFCVKPDGTPDMFCRLVATKGRHMISHRNIFHLQRKCNLSNEQLKKIHYAALAGKDGWKYMWMNKWYSGCEYETKAQLLFECCIGIRKLMIPRGPSTALPSTKPTKPLQEPDLPLPEPSITKPPLTPPLVVDHKQLVIDQPLCCRTNTLVAASKQIVIHKPLFCRAMTQLVAVNKQIIIHKPLILGVLKIRV